MTDRQEIAVLANGINKNWGNPFKLFDDDPLYAATTPGDPARGQQAFTRLCARCRQGADGTGGKSSHGESLGSIVDPAYLALISDQGLRSLILAGQFDKTPHDWRSYSSTHALTDQELADIVRMAHVQYRIATPGQPYPSHP